MPDEVATRRAMKTIRILLALAAVPLVMALVLSLSLQTVLPEYARAASLRDLGRLNLVLLESTYVFAVLGATGLYVVLRWLRCVTLGMFIFSGIVLGVFLFEVTAPPGSVDFFINAIKGIHFIHSSLRETLIEDAHFGTAGALVFLLFWIVIRPDQAD